MQAARIGSTVLHYSDSAAPGGGAAGTTLVFANSLGTDLRVWDPLLPHLPQGLRIVRYDKRGHGLSDCPPGPYGIDDLVGELAGLLDHLAVRRAVVIGLSVGGMIAQGLAAARPDIVQAAVFCCTGHVIGTAEMWGQRIEALREVGIEGMADNVMERWFSPAFRSGRPEDLAAWRNMLTRTPEAGYVATCAALRDADLTAGTAALKIPVLCVAGSNDGATPAGPGEVAGRPGARRALRAAGRPRPYPLRRGAGGAGRGNHPFPEGERPCLTPMAVPASTPACRPGARCWATPMSTAPRRRSRPFDADFQRFITEGAWGSVWSRPGLTRRERSLITIALLAALGHHDEVAMHVRATANTGATPEDVKEAMLHVAVYAGVPAANSAIRVAKAAFAEMQDAKEAQEKTS